MNETKTVAIIGAGPVGLPAAAHVLERGLRPVVLEAGDSIGHAVRQWGHVQLFSPWEYNIDRAAARLLAPTGWNSPDPAAYPTGAEFFERYLEPLASKTALRTRIHTSSRVAAISRAGFDKLKTKGREAAPFEIRYQNGQGPKIVRADAVIDASGTWHSPNPAGAKGLRALGEQQAGHNIAYGMPEVLGKDRARYAGKTVAVLGAGHSAIGTLTDLAKLAAQAPENRPTWLLRGNDPTKAFGGGANGKARRPWRVGRCICGAGGRGPDKSGAQISRLGSDRRRPSPHRRSRRWRSQGGGRRTHCCHRLPAGSGFRARASHSARPGDRVPGCAGAADRSERTQLRHRAAALSAGTGAARTGLLFCRHEILRPRADVSDDHRIRTGALDCRRTRRRS